jgi:hypothetical protein
MIVVDSRKPVVLVGLAAAVVVALVFAWFGVRWQIGNMLGELTSSNDPNIKEVSELALKLAPHDPLSYWLAANSERETFSEESIERSLKLLEEAVRLSPNDFRWWIELGRANEQAERPENAESALRRAVELAPEYTFPRWQLGNFYLRQNRIDEAFAELMKTTEKSGVYREQVFSLAWDYFDKDPEQIERLMADTPDIRASLALYYATRNAPQDALRNWRMLTDEQKAADPQVPRSIAQGFHDKRFYTEAIEFSREAGIDPEAKSEAITNGGFEKFIGAAEDTLFGWRINRAERGVYITPDSAVVREGNRSLRVVFRNFNNPEMYNITQVVAVRPGGRYRLSFWVRTEGLTTGGPPLVQVINGQTDELIEQSKPFPLGSQDWHQYTVDFDVPNDSDGVFIRTSRIYCGEQCPITGTFWYDDFALTRIS